MPNNIVFITNLETNYDTINYATYCLNTWKYWCEKHDVQLIVLDTPITDPSYMKATWQRWHVLDILDQNGIEYDQVALVDVDTMIKWDAPNFFELTENKFAACSDNDNIGWVVDSINGYQRLFTDVSLDWTEYFNCGFIVLNKTHKSLCDTITKFWSENSDTLIHMQTTLRKGTDQTPVNFIAKRDTDIIFLNKKWNLTHLNRKELINDLKFINNGYVWHFNGFEKNLRNEIMQVTWENIKHNYEN